MVSRDAPIPPNQSTERMEDVEDITQLPEPEDLPVIFPPGDLNEVRGRCWDAITAWRRNDDADRFICRFSPTCRMNRLS